MGKHLKNSYQWKVGEELKLTLMHRAVGKTKKWILQSTIQALYGQGHFWHFYSAQLTHKGSGTGYLWPSYVSLLGNYHIMQIREGKILVWSITWKEFQSFPRTTCLQYFSHLFLGSLMIKIPLAELEICSKTPLTLRERRSLDWKIKLHDAWLILYLSKLIWLWWGSEVVLERR